MDTIVYKYMVCWQEKPYVWEWEWRRKTFASKKEAKKFAREHKDKLHKPYPYIVRTVCNRHIFRADVEVEQVKGDNPCPRKFIKY